VKVLDPGTRHGAGAQRFVFTGPSGHYRAVVRMALAAAVATATLPFDVRRGVVSVTLKPAVVEWENAEQLRFVLREGKKRQIRRMCEQVGLKVVGLKRIRIGRVVLGNLPVGQWRYLGPQERF